MAVILNYPLFHADDDNGAPLTGGLLYTYEAGTSTAKATYTDRSAGTANANPVVLDSRGEAIVYGAGIYKLILQTSAGVTVWTQDNVELGSGIEWDGTTTTIASLTLATGATLTEFSTDGTMAGNSDTAVPTEKAVVTYVASYSNAARVGRSTFTYNGGTTAYTVKATGAAYWCSDKMCQWITELTTTAISIPVASTWYYLYLDYSAITSGTAITNAELIWSSTAPTWSDTYRQWLNGDDRCIFAVRTNSGPTNILEFFHAGDETVILADYIADTEGAITPNVTWTDMTFVPPAFASRVKATFYCYPTAGMSSASLFYWRRNGQTGTTGHLSGVAFNGNTGYSLIYSTQSIDVMVDSSGKVEVKASVTDNASIIGYMDGFCFPGGM